MLNARMPRRLQAPLCTNLGTRSDRLEAVTITGDGRTSGREPAASDGGASNRKFPDRTRTTTR